MRKTVSLIENKKIQEIFIVVVAVKEIDKLNHKDTTSQVHNILKEVLFIANNGKICSQNKDKQQLKNFLTESVNKLSSFSDFYLLWFIVGTLLWKEISSVKQSKSHNFSFNKHRRTLFSRKIFHQMDILCEIEMNEKTGNEWIWRVYQKHQWRNHWKKITEKMNE